MATDDRKLVETVAEAAWKGSVLGSKPPLWAGWDTLDPVAQDVFRVMARSVVAALREADLLWEPSPQRCDDERLRPGGYPTRNWDWVKCDEEKGHEGEHENNETGLHWADDAPQYL